MKRASEGTKRCNAHKSHVDAIQHACSNLPSKGALRLHIPAKFSPCASVFLHPGVTTVCTRKRVMSSLTPLQLLRRCPRQLPRSDVDILLELSLPAPHRRRTCWCWTDRMRLTSEGMFATVGRVRHETRPAGADSKPSCPPGNGRPRTPGFVVKKVLPSPACQVSKARVEAWPY